MKKSVFYSVFIFVLMIAFSQTLSAQSFTLANGKLGPVQVGKAIGKQVTPMIFYHPNLIIY